MSDEHGYSPADLPLYFEWHGETHGPRPPLLLVHGGGSTIESNWGNLIPLDLKEIVALDIAPSASSASSFDIWIDNLQFIP